MNWQRTRLKYLAARPIVNGLGESAALEDESWPRYIRTTDFAGPRTLREETKATLPPAVARKAEVRRGDLLMSAAGTVGKTFLYNSDAPACYAGYLVRFRPTANVDPRFVAYWTETPLFLDQIETGKVTSTIDNFSASKYQNLSLSVPDRNTQRAIADYLDSETARIDALIDKKQRMRDLVGERRLATITLTTAPDWAIEAVLHDRPVIPLDGWSLRSLKDLTDPAVPIVYGILLAGPRLEEGIPYLGAGDVRPDRMRLDRLPRTTADIAAEYPRSRIREGEIVYAIRGTFGKVELVPATLEGANLSRDVARIRPAPGISPEWLLWALRAELAQEQFRRNEVGTAVTGVNIGDLKKVKLAVPPSIGDQERIAIQVRRATSRLDRLDATIGRQLELLREHREALISAAVTGEFEVSGVAA